MNYFRTILIIIPALICGVLSAQCIADAGPPELHLCLGHGKSYLQASVSGGQAPYSYKWSMETEVYNTGSTTYYYHASDYLDDTTAANPQVMFLIDSIQTFYLEVTDANSQSCYDTVHVTTSGFSSFPVTWQFHINKGDSAQFYGPQSGSNYPTDSIYWYPAISLSNPNALAPKASPDTTTPYSYIIWDSKGCSDTTTFASIVYVGNLSSTHFATQQLEVFPTKLKSPGDLIIKKPDRAELDFLLLNVHGQKILQTRISQKDNRVHLPHVPNGVYFYQLTHSNSIHKKGKILIEP